MQKNRFFQLLESKLGNVKPLLNEQYSNFVTVDLKKGTLTLNIKIDFEHTGSGGDELRLTKGVTFSKRPNGTLVTSNQNFQLVGDINGTVRDSGLGTITYYCKTKTLDIKGRSDLYFNENWPDAEKGFQDLCNAPMPAPAAPKDPQYNNTQCEELKRRQQTPVIANAGDIQTFLKGMGQNIAVDYAFGNGTATAYGTFMYGSTAGINSVQTLWQKLKDEGLDVGTTPGFGPKMAQAVAKEINDIVPTLVSKRCVSPKA